MHLVLIINDESVCEGWKAGSDSIYTGGARFMPDLFEIEFRWRQIGSTPRFLELSNVMHFFFPSISRLRSSFVI